MIVIAILLGLTVQQLTAGSYGWATFWLILSVAEAANEISYWRSERRIQITYANPMTPTNEPHK